MNPTKEAKVSAFALQLFEGFLKDQKNITENYLPPENQLIHVKRSYVIRVIYCCFLHAFLMVHILSYSHKHISAIDLFQVVL